MDIELKTVPDSTELGEITLPSSDLISSFDDVLKSAEPAEKDRNFPPPLGQDLSDIEENAEDVVPNEDPISNQEMLIDLCSAITNQVDSLDLTQVEKNTVTYVDNDNKSVLLINKYLLSTGRKPIPVIAPSLAYLVLSAVAPVDESQGDVVLYEDDSGAASLGILVSAPKNGKLNYKLLTTNQDKICMITVDADRVHKTMR